MRLGQLLCENQFVSKTRDGEKPMHLNPPRWHPRSIPKRDDRGIETEQQLFSAEGPQAKAMKAGIRRRFRQENPWRNLKLRQCSMQA